MPPSEKMQMQMGHGFPPVRSIVDDQPITGFFELELATDTLGGGEKMAENGMILRRHGRVAGMVFFGNQKNMNGCLRADVPEGEDVLVLVHDIGGHLAIDDALENRLGHGADYQMVSSRREGLRV